MAQYSKQCPKQKFSAARKTILCRNKKLDVAQKVMCQQKQVDVARKSVSCLLKQDDAAQKKFLC